MHDQVTTTINQSQTNKYQEVRELQALAQTQPADTKEFFKNEIALAIRDISDEYEAIAHQIKADMESWYKLKVWNV